jgi:hypothetical protein
LGVGTLTVKPKRDVLYLADVTDTRLSETIAEFGE